MALYRASVGVFIFLAAVAAVPAGADSGEEPVPTYNIIDLGTFGGWTSVATGINEVGQVVGAADRPAGHRHAFIWEDGRKRTLAPLAPYIWSEADDVNNLGQVVGVSGYGAAILWWQGELIDLGHLTGAATGDTSASAVNDAGQIVGISTAGPGERHAFLWQDGVMIDLGTLGGTHSIAWDINAAGQVVGASYIGSGEHAFLWENGVMTDLGTLGGTHSEARGINDLGQVVGRSLRADNGSFHAFLWEDGEMTDLGAIAGFSSSGANAINNVGQVLLSTHLYDINTGVLLDPEDLIPPDSGWTSLSPRDLNDAGQIAGVGTIDGARHAFLMTPIKFGRCCFDAATSPQCVDGINEEDCAALDGPRFFSADVDCPADPGDCPTDCNENGIADQEESDADDDGLIDDCDNCPDSANMEQEDGDGDGRGDPCDPCPVDNPDDSDGDGVCDSDDGCPADPQKSTPGICGCGVDDYADEDHDEVPDCVDQCKGVDDMIFAPECEGSVPTTSHWGLVILALLLLAAGKVYFTRRGRAV